MPSVTYNLNGPKAFTFSYPIRYKSEVVLQVVPGTVVPDSQYQVIGAGPESTGVTVQWPLAPIDGTKQLVIERYVDPNRVSDFTGNGIDSVSLDSEFDHIYSLYGDIDTELDRALKYPVTDTSAYDAETRRIKNLGDPVAAQDAATKSWTETLTAGIRAAIDAAEALLQQIQSLVQDIGQPKVKKITADYTITAADSFSIFKCDNPSDITVTLPRGMSAGFNSTFIRVNTGDVTFAADSLRVPTPFDRRLRTVDSAASASCLDSVAGTWMLAGDLADVLVPPGPGPGPGTPRMFVTNSGSNSVSVIDVATAAVVATVPVGTAPYDIVSNGASLLYVVNVGGTVSVVSAATNSVNATIQLLSGAAALVLVGDTLYVANAIQNSVAVVDTTTNVVINNITVGDGPADIVSDGSKVYTVNADDGTITVISGGVVTATWTVSLGISAAAYDGADSLYVINFRTDRVEIVSTVDGSSPTFVSVGDTPAGIAYDGASRMYVTNNRDDTVSVIDISTDTVVATIAVGQEPGGVGFDNAGLVYVSNSLDGTVSVIDPSTDTVTDTISVGTTPAGIAYAVQP